MRRTSELRNIHFGRRTAGRSFRPDFVITEHSRKTRSASAISEYLHAASDSNFELQLVLSRVSRKTTARGCSYFIATARVRKFGIDVSCCTTRMAIPSCEAQLLTTTMAWQERCYGESSESSPAAYLSNPGKNLPNSVKKCAGSCVHILCSRNRVVRRAVSNWAGGKYGVVRPPTTIRAVSAFGAVGLCLIR